MSEPEGFFTQPWRGSEAGAAPNAAAPADVSPDAASGGAATAGAADGSPGGPLEGFPSLDVSAAVEAQIAAIPPDGRGWPVWQRAMTCIEHGLAKCEILEMLAAHQRDPVAKDEMATAMRRERADLAALRDRYQGELDEYEASLERAAAIRQKAEAEALVQEAARQAIRDDIAKAQREQAQLDWKAGTARADASHKAYMASLTNKYWSSS